MLVWIALLTACSQPTVTGKVVDGAGQPIPGATIMAAGTLCQSETEDDGAFSLSCSQGDLLITVLQGGYFSQEIEIAEHEGAHEIGAVRLINEPPGEGIYLFTSAQHNALTAAYSVREDPRRKTKRNFVVDRDNTKPNQVKAGEVQLFDWNYNDWKIWAVDPDGSIYRDQKNKKGRWEQKYAEAPELRKDTLGSGQILVTMQLEPGEYFIADWMGGFFHKKQGTQQLTGYLLVAE